MKQLDKLLTKSFVGPFIVTFAIALFVLLMQILWLYLDDIAGKGLGFFVVLELMAYKCVGLVPLALPLALLISSVMVLGNLAEHYELSSFKSAGVSLLRVMRMLILFGTVGAAVSYLCSDYVIPAANLQFGARMYDIQQKKPTLNMEPGVFNEDFNQFSIRLGRRDDNGRDIGDVLIYDHTRANTGELSQILADDGEMYASEDGKFFVMHLRDGFQYVEQRPGGRSGKEAPFLRTRFGSYTKVFDLSEFKLEKHAASLFQTNRSMLSTWQLQKGVDSIDLNILVRKQNLSNQLSSYLRGLPRDTIVYRVEEPNRDLITDLGNLANGDTATAARPDVVAIQAEADVAEGPIRPVGAAPPPERRLPGPRQIRDLSRDSTLVAQELRERRSSRYREARRHPLVTATQDWQGLRPLLTAMSGTERTRVLTRARSGVRAVKSQAEAAMRIIPGEMESRVKHVYDLHMKYSMAVICIIFIFIGAPMGAIVRKGGFGYPILVSIIFFVIFIILTIFCRKLAESFVVNGVLAGWMPCLIMFPISLWITHRARNDAKLVSTDRVGTLLRSARDSRQVRALRQAIARRGK